MPFDMFNANLRTASRQAAATDDYQSGTLPTISIPDLVSIETPTAISITGGYVAEIDSTDGNTITYQVFEDNGTASDAPLGEIADSTDLSSETLTVAAQGY